MGGRGLVPCPLHPFAFLGVKFDDSYLVRREGNLETIVVFTRNELPADTDRYPIGILRLIEQVLYRMLTIWLAVRRYLDINSVVAVVVLNGCVIGMRRVPGRHLIAPNMC